MPASQPARRAAPGAVALLALLAACATMLPPPAALAQAVWGARTSAYDVGEWTDATFAGATARYAIRLDANPLASSVGTFRGTSFETLTEARNLFWQGDDDYVAATNVTVASPARTTADVTLVSLDPALAPAVFPGSMRLGYTTGVVDLAPDAFTRSWIARGVVGSRWALTFKGGGKGFFERGRFDVHVDFAGDWTDPARHAVLGVNAGWTVEAPSFDGRVTRFHAFTPSYAGNTEAPGGNPNLVVQLYGAFVPTLVPEPGTLALTGAGLLLLAHLRGRRRHRNA